jgi:uncharacterized damage-inducible protein DinB
VKALDLIKTLNYILENQTQFVCSNLSDEQARWRPETGSPAIGWTVGHIIVDHDLTANNRLCENELLYDDLMSFFGIGTDGEFPDQFTLKDLFEKFKILNGEIISCIKSKKDEWLNEMFDTSGFPPNWHNKNIGKGFLMHINHGLTHTGQIIEVKRMQGLGAWGF